jgi:hypothetical protein
MKVARTIMGHLAFLGGLIKTRFTRRSDPLTAATLVGHTENAKPELGEIR